MVFYIRAHREIVCAIVLLDGLRAPRGCSQGQRLLRRRLEAAREDRGQRRGALPRERLERLEIRRLRVVGDGQVPAAAAPLHSDRRQSVVFIANRQQSRNTATKDN